MSTMETEDTRVVHSGVVFHPHFWFGHGEPPPGFYGAAAHAEANATVHVNGGNGSTATFAPPYPAPPMRPALFSRSISGPSLELLGWLLLAVATVLAAFGLIALGHWIFSGSGTKAAPAPVGKTVPQVLASEHFTVSEHALCRYETVANGTAYKLYLNRGGACRRTVQAIIPAQLVSGFRSHYVRRPSVTFVYKKTRLSPRQTRQLKQLALGQQVMRNLRFIVAREHQ